MPAACIVKHIVTLRVPAQVSLVVRWDLVKAFQSLVYLNHPRGLGTPRSTNLLGLTDSLGQSSPSVGLLRSCGVAATPTQLSGCSSLPGGAYSIGSSGFENELKVKNSRMYGSRTLTAGEKKAPTISKPMEDEFCCMYNRTAGCNQYKPRDTGSIYNLRTPPSSTSQSTPLREHARISSLSLLRSIGPAHCRPIRCQEAQIQRRCAPRTRSCESVLFLIAASH